MGRAAGWIHPFRLRSRVKRRLVPLTVSFGVLSFALTLVLGVVLGGLIQHQVKSQSEADLAASTRIATVITIHTIVSELTYGTNGIPGNADRNWPKPPRSPRLPACSSTTATSSPSRLSWSTAP